MFSDLLKTLKFCRYKIKLEKSILGERERERERERENIYFHWQPQGLNIWNGNANDYNKTIKSNKNIKRLIKSTFKGHNCTINGTFMLTLQTLGFSLSLIEK